MKYLVALILALALPAHAACTAVKPSPYPWLKFALADGGVVAAQWHDCVEGTPAAEIRFLDGKTLDAILTATRVDSGPFEIGDAIINAAWPLLPANDPRYVAAVKATSAAVLAAKPAPVPAPSASVWVVNADASNAAVTARPAYPLVNGKRSIVSDVTAKVGAVCSCSTYVIEGAAVFCAIPPESLSAAVNGARVAGCHKR